MPPEPAIAAHRGGAALWPENTLLAFRHAAALPIHQVELDVHLSADGVPVVIHDATLERTTHGAGAVGACTAAALSGVALRGVAGEGVPTLEAAAALLRDAGKILRLEFKVDAGGRPYPGLVAACVGVLDGTGMRGRTIAIGFAPVTMAEAATAGFAGTALLFTAWGWRGLGPMLAAGLCRTVGAPELGLPFGECDTPRAVAAIRATGLRLGAWGVDDAAAIARGRALGLDVLTTDDPRAGCGLAVSPSM